VKHIVFIYLDSVISDQLAQEFEGPFAIQELDFSAAQGMIEVLPTCTE
jgi:hypothetical protein